MARTLITAALLSDVGRRHNNEDAMIVADLTEGLRWRTSPHSVEAAVGQAGFLLAVSDGSGEVVGEMALEGLASAVSERLFVRMRAESAAEALRTSLQEVNASILKATTLSTNFLGMGATATAVLVKGRKAVIGQVGDSRAYLVRQGRLVQLTKDQTFIQGLLDDGLVTEEEAATHPFRNVIMYALGGGQDMKPGLTLVRLARGDLLILCTDCLWKMASNDEILRVATERSDLMLACQALVNLAKHGGEDNITVVMARIDGAGLPPPTPVAPVDVNNPNE